MKVVFSAFLGRISAIAGFLSVIVLLALLPNVCHDLPCPQVPLSYDLLVAISLGSPIIGAVGSWALEKHRKGGSLTLAVAGSLPLIAGLIFFLAHGDLLVDLFSLLFFLWWSPLLILAGVLGHFEPSKSTGQPR